MATAEVHGTGSEVELAVPVFDEQDLIVGPDFARHLADVARLAVSLTILAVTVMAARLSPRSVRSASLDFVRLVLNLPVWLQDVLVGTAQLIALIGPLVVLLGLRRQRRLLVEALVAAVIAAGTNALLQRWFDATVPSTTVNLDSASSWVTGAAFPSGTFLAAVAAGLVVIGSVLSRGWRRLSLGVLLVGALARTVTAVAAPLNVLAGLSLGAAIGSLALVVLGAPRHRASRTDVLAGMTGSGFPATQVKTLPVEATHSRTFEADTDDGRRGFVKLFGTDERDADLLVRAWKRLRVRGLDDERPGWSTARKVEHEALAGLLAGQHGVPVAGVLAQGSTDAGDGLLVLQPLDGVTLDRLPVDLLTDELLDELWRTLAKLHEQRISHQWLTAHHVLVDPDGRVHLLDFHWAVVNAADDHLATDVAQLAVTLAAIVGAERAVSTAARVIPVDRLAQALPLVQPLVFPDDLRAVVDAHDGILQEVRDQLQAVAQVERYELRPLERLTTGRLFGLVGGIVLGYCVLTFSSSVGEIGDALRDVSWGFLPALVVLAFVPYLTGAVSLLGVSPKSLPIVEVTELMLGQSFLNKFTPANAAGMALRVRYLQKEGIDVVQAGAGVGLTSVANGIVQAVALVAFGFWARSATDVGFQIPEASMIALVIVVLLIAAGVVWLTPWGRRMFAPRLGVAWSSVMDLLASIAHQPSKSVQLFGGALAGKIASIAAFILTCEAFGIGLAYSRLGFLYLTATTVASAAPTPGGLGAVEAALLAALTGAGVPSATAMSVVIVFRLVTYWLPVLPGWIALTRMRRRQLV